MSKAEVDGLIEEMFKADADNNGVLSKSEIKNYLEKNHGSVSDADLQQFIDGIDQNEDNMISRVEVTKRLY